MCALVTCSSERRCVFQQAVKGLSLTLHAPSEPLPSLPPSPPSPSIFTVCVFQGGLCHLQTRWTGDMHTQLSWRSERQRCAFVSDSLWARSAPRGCFKYLSLFFKKKKQLFPLSESYGICREAEAFLPPPKASPSWDPTDALWHEGKRGEVGAGESASSSLFSPRVFFFLTFKVGNISWVTVPYWTPTGSVPFDATCMVMGPGPSWFGTKRT